MINLDELVICSCDRQPQQDNLNGETAYLDSILEFLPIVIVITDSWPIVWPEFPRVVNTWSRVIQLKTDKKAREKEKEKMPRKL